MQADAFACSTHCLMASTSAPGDHTPSTSALNGTALQCMAAPGFPGVQQQEDGVVLPDQRLQRRRVPPHRRLLAPSDQVPRHRHAEVHAADTDGRQNRLRATLVVSSASQEINLSIRTDRVPFMTCCS